LSIILLISIYITFFIYNYSTSIKLFNYLELITFFICFTIIIYFTFFIYF